MTVFHLWIAQIVGKWRISKIPGFFPALLLLSLSGCDWVAELHYRVFNDPTRVIRFTTVDGHSIVLMRPDVDYLGVVGIGHYDRNSFVEGRGLRTEDGIIEWAAFSTLSIGDNRHTAAKAGKAGYKAEIRLGSGAMVVSELKDAPNARLRGWRKADDLPLAFGYVRVGISLLSVSRIEVLDSSWERVPYSNYKTFRIAARHKVDGTCEGEARLYHPLTTESNVHATRDDPALGFRVEDRGMLLEIDPADVREMSIGKGEGKAMTTFTFNDGSRRAYAMRDAYFKMNALGRCDRVVLLEQRTITISVQQ